MTDRPVGRLRPPPDVRVVGEEPATLGPRGRT
jgi:hypothetical protein